MGEYKNELDEVFVALADSTRREILQQLLRSPARVTELAEPHSISLNSVSKHLKILERAELVRREIRGREHWFSFQEAKMRFAEDWVTSTLAFWAKQVDALEQLLESDEMDAR